MVLCNIFGKGSTAVKKAILYKTETNNELWASFIFKCFAPKRQARINDFSGWTIVLLDDSTIALRTAAHAHTQHNGKTS